MTHRAHYLVEKSMKDWRAIWSVVMIVLVILAAIWSIITFLARFMSTP